jgi:hypothetical protein
MRAIRKQMSKFLSIFLSRFVLECRELGKRKIFFFLKKKKILKILIFAGVGILVKKFWVNRRFNPAVKSTIPPYCD